MSIIIYWEHSYAKSGVRFIAGLHHRALIDQLHRASDGIDLLKHIVLIESKIPLIGGIFVFMLF